MKLIRIYSGGLAVILLCQGVPLLRIPLAAIVGLIVVAGGLVLLEALVELRKIGKDIERIEKLEKTTENVWNELQNRMNAVESTVNLRRVGQHGREQGA